MNYVLVFILLSTTYNSNLFSQKYLENYKGQLDSATYLKCKIISDSLPFFDTKTQAQKLIQARGYVDLTNIKLALEYQYDAINKYRSIGEDSLAMARYTNTSFLHMGLAEMDTSQSILNIAFAYWSKKNDINWQANTLRNMGHLEYISSRYHKALENFNKSLNLVIKLDPYHSLLPDLYNRIGLLYLAIENPQAAYDILKSAIDQIESGKLPKKMYGTLLINLIDAMKQLGITERFDEYQEYTMNLWLNRKQIKRKMYGYGIMFDRYMTKGDEEKAKFAIEQYFKFAYEFDDPRFKVHANIKQYNLHRKFYPKSTDLKYLDEALIYADSSKESRLTKEIFNNYSAYYNSIGDYKKAYLYYQKYDSLRNEIFSKDKLMFISQLEQQEILNQAAREKEILIIQSKINEKEIQDAKRDKIGLTIISFLLLMVGAWIYYLYRAKKGYSKALDEKNDQLKLALEDNNDLFKEIHHRVKNNLQLVSSFLSLQTRFTTDDKSIEVLKSSRMRIQSMALLHQNLYGKEAIQKVSLVSYFTDLCSNIFDTLGADSLNIQLDLDIVDVEIDIDIVISMGLIATELVTNSIKHAFDNKVGLIKVIITLENNEICMSISDNGKGFLPKPEDNKKSLGMLLISSFIEKLDADVKFVIKKGTTVNIRIPIANKDLIEN